MGTLLLDCTHGARKESLVAVLLDQLDADDREAFMKDFDTLGFGVRLCVSDADQRDVCGHRAHGHHGHDDHRHEHHALAEVQAAIEALAVSGRVKQNALGVYDILADAEAQAHNVPVDEVHFHEVGNASAIAHIVAFCMLMERLGFDDVTATPITTGFGYVDCAHGRLPIPAPATANVLEGLPVRRGDVEGELTTPTGAAIVRYFADRYTEE